MNYRKFFLENSNDQLWYLAEEGLDGEKVFLNNPTGLGYSNTLTTYQYSNALNLVSSEQNFGTIGGEFLFYADSNEDKYGQYHQFIDFLSYEPLILIYTVPGDIETEYTCDVAVASVDKTEVKTDGYMRCAFSLQMLSRWRGSSIGRSENLITQTINNPGHFPVGFEIILTGDLENPYFTLSQDGEVYGEAKFEDVTNFESVSVNSEDGKQSVELYQNGSLLANPLSYQDLSISNGSIYVTFVKLARGESELTVGFDSGTLDNVTWRFTPIYRSV